MWQHSGGRRLAAASSVDLISRECMRSSKSLRTLLAVVALILLTVSCVTASPATSTRVTAQTVSSSPAGKATFTDKSKHQTTSSAVPTSLTAASSNAASTTRLLEPSTSPIAADDLQSKTPAAAVPDVPTEQGLASTRAVPATAGELGAELPVKNETAFVVGKKSDEKASKWDDDGVEATGGRQFDSVPEDQLELGGDDVLPPSRMQRRQPPIRRPSRPRPSAAAVTPDQNNPMRLDSEVNPERSSIKTFESRLFSYHQRQMQRAGMMSQNSEGLQGLLLQTTSSPQLQDGHVVDDPMAVDQPSSILQRRPGSYEAASSANQLASKHSLPSVPDDPYVIQEVASPPQQQQEPAPASPPGHHQATPDSSNGGLAGRDAGQWSHLRLQSTRVEERTPGKNQSPLAEGVARGPGMANDGAVGSRLRTGNGGRNRGSLLRRLRPNGRLGGSDRPLGSRSRQGVSIGRSRVDSSPSRDRPGSSRWSSLSSSGGGRNPAYKNRRPFLHRSRTFTSADPQQPAAPDVTTAWPQQPGQESKQEQPRMDGQRREDTRVMPASAANQLVEQMLPQQAPQEMVHSNFGAQQVPQVAGIGKMQNQVPLNMMQAPSRSDDQEDSPFRASPNKSGRSSPGGSSSAPTTNAATSPSANNVSTSTPNTSIPEQFYMPRPYDSAFRGAIAYVGGKHEDGTEGEGGGSSGGVGGGEDPLSMGGSSAWGDQDKGMPKHGILVDRQNGGGMQNMLGGSSSFG